MAGVSSYRRLFRIETEVRAVMIVSSLKKLVSDPSNKGEIEALLNNADVVIGDAKFLGNKALEENTKVITSTFKKPKEQRTSSEINLLLNRFTEIVWGDGFG
ncbi:hypothetical protein [Candidatus Nitrosotenuis cloacae]|jgi:hypothetical protein|uniref:hypothetical protein n=1 Tax=Candidatus Nitrosotenuis cloacae TaxID=1603555 RepID=UPI002281F106|nr:hypothetical protein [Candidatus Nitrosotenuis cloacae]